MALITPERAKQLAPQLSRLTAEQLAAYLGSASTAIEAVCGRKFAKSIVSNEYVRLDQFGTGYLERTPVVTGTLSLTDVEAQAVNRWRLDTESGELEAPAYRERIVVASYTGGFDATPYEIELGVATLAKISSDRMASQASGEIASKEIGSVTVSYANLSTLQAVPVIPKSVMDMISPYIMPRPIC